MILTKRLQELRDCNCPPERPCRPEDCLAFQGYTPGVTASAGSSNDLPATAPALVQQISNLSVEVNNWIAAGRPLTPPDKLAERQTQCQTCDRYDASADRCLQCGCFGNALPLWAKIAAKVIAGETPPGKLHMATASCPKQPPRWKALVVLNESGQPVGA